MDALIRIVSAFNDRQDKARNSRHDADDIEESLTRLFAPFGGTRLPELGETAAIALDTPKSAALLFNRVWGIGDDIPAGIRFGSGTYFEVAQILGLAHLLRYQRHHGGDSFFPPLERSQLVEILERGKKERYRFDGSVNFSIEKTATRVLDDILGDDDILGNSPSAPDNLGSFTTAFSRRLAKWYQLDRGIEAQPVYPSTASMNSEYRAGGYGVLVASLSNLELINEEKLEWEQVLEFRRDKGAQRKLARFLRWADSNLLNLSVANIAAEIESRLEDYKWATKKHGIKTAVGAISTVLDPKVLTSIGVVAGSLALGTSPAIGALTGAGIALGKMVVKVIEGSLDLAEQRRTLHPEVAYVLEVEKRLGK